MKQFIEEILWEMIENFYQAMLLFQQEHQEFKKKIETISKNKDKMVDLMEILSVEEVLSLLNLNNIEDLREKYIQPLIKLSSQFKQVCYCNDAFNHGIQDIYHELSILQSEFSKLGVIAPGLMEFKTEKRYKSIVGGYHICLPLKVFQLSHKMETAQKELEKMISPYKERDILVRSIFLFGEEIIGRLSENSFLDFVKRIYPSDHLLELYTRASYAFLKAGFYDFTKVAVRKAKNILEEERYNFSDIWTQKLQTISFLVCETQKKIIPADLL
ncbi:MAG: hypothetical protein HUU50_01395 [Candidatus Brocadiae bacterium]|nr:hypothetical protein [Candidatus Brocadiia bacterium]